MDHWLSIEIFDGEFPASRWWLAHGDNLTEAAITNGALHWQRHEHRWGVVIELEFSDENDRDRFRELPAVCAALDAAPDPVSGVLVYPGRGGGSGARVPRRPRPRPSSGAAARAVPADEQFIRLSSNELA